jgi:uncharacterized protein DUF2834
METKKIYLLFCVVGLVVPYPQLVAWVLANGLDISSFLRDMFANRIAGFFAADVIVSAVVLIAFVGREGNRTSTRLIPIIATLSVGVSLGLPLFLYLRELEREK